MAILKMISVLSVLLMCSVSFSQSYTLRDNNSGESFHCGATGGSGGINPECVKEVSTYCYSNTSYSKDVCYEKASSGCGGSHSDYSSCIKSTVDYCYSNTSNSKEKCFDLALGSCKGSALEMHSLMDSVKLDSAIKILKKNRL